MTLHNLPILKTYRKNLRNDSSSAEVTLWQILKGKQIDGLKFRRQHSFGKYIMDFYCPSLKLGIELDGHYHIYTEEIDKKRDEFINSHGISILRYENRFVFEFREQIIIDILEFKEKHMLK